MRIVVNATALHTAGGRTVGLGFLKAFRDCPQGHTADVFVPPNCGYEALDGSVLRIHPVPPRLLRGVSRLYLDHVWLPGRVRRLTPDVVFSMANFALPVTLPQLVLFMWPYAIYPESPVWVIMGLTNRMMHRFRRRVFTSRLRYASAVAAQTPTAKARLERLYCLPCPVYIVPAGTPLPAPDGAALEAAVEAWGPEAGDVRRLFCLTRYYPHKNLEVFLPLARLIRARRLPYRILTTVAPEHGAEAVRFLEGIEAPEVKGIVVNKGPIPYERLPAFYAAADGLLLPTYLESFSSTYVEAMYYRVPVFTSDLDFARDATGGHAFFFNPADPKAILSTLEQAFTSEAVRNHLVADARAYIETVPDWTEVANIYFGLLERIGS